MRISIKRPDRRGFSLVVPFWLFTFFLNGPFLRLAAKSAPEEARVWVETLDVQAVRRAFGELRAHRGLELVRVDAADGTQVRIVV